MSVLRFVRALYSSIPNARVLCHMQTAYHPTPVSGVPPHVYGYPGVKHPSTAKHIAVLTKVMWWSGLYVYVYMYVYMHYHDCTICTTRRVVSSITSTT